LFLTCLRFPALCCCFDENGVHVKFLCLADAAPMFAAVTAWGHLLLALAAAAGALTLLTAAFTDAPQSCWHT
jgi:hypothetical protein